MNTPLPLQDLVAKVVREYPDAHLELHPLPSGVCFFWASLYDHDFVIEYHPRDGAGVSENSPTTTPFDGHDRWFASLAEAVNYFKSLLANAAVNPKNEAMRVHAV